MKLSEHIKIFTRGVRYFHSLSSAFVICLILMSITASILPYVPIYFSARLLDALYAGEPTETLALYVLLTVGLAFCLNLFQTYLSSRFSAALNALYRNERWQYAEKAMGMSYSSMEDSNVTLLRDRIKMETQTGYNMYFLQYGIEYLTRHIVTIFMSLSLTLSFFFLDAIPLHLKLLFVAGIALTAVCGIFTTDKSAKMEFSFFEKNVQMNVFAEKYGKYLKDYSSGKDIRVYDMADSLLARSLEQNTNYNKKFLQMNLRQFFIKLPDDIMTHLLRFGTYMLLVYAALMGNVTVGSIARYVSCVMLMLEGISGLITVLQRTTINNHYLKRYFSYFDIPNDMYQGTLTVEKRDDNEYFVEFRDVSFRYPGTEAYALRHVSLKFKIGEKLALVGMNGSGKTTFIKLMCRLYDPSEGEILLNGVNIKKYDYDEYMSIFSVVFQDFLLFAFQLGQNVAANQKWDASRAEQTLRRAGFGERLASLPDGTETYLYKHFDKSGVEISGGEAQKIALARALYKDAPFIILDEPTSALDPISEYEVYSKFNEIAGDKTAIYISHRLASCRFCDKIAVFHKGAIVQTGSHETLLAQAEGKYYELWNAQAQYYTKEGSVGA